MLAVKRTFDGNANMLSESRAGVTTNFTHTPQGEVATRTDAGGKTTTYSDYFRGIARTENQPEGVVVTRTVKSAGNVTAQTDGELATTQVHLRRFEPGHRHQPSARQSRGRRLGRQLFAPSRRVPIGSWRVSTAWASGARTAHGHAARRNHYPGLPSRFAGASRVRLVSKRCRGNVFHLRHAEPAPVRFQRVQPGHRGLDQLSQETHTSYTTQLLNERGFGYVFRYRSYGDPDKRELLAIFDPLSNVENTTIARNIAGQITTVTQDGVCDPMGKCRVFS